MLKQSLYFWTFCGAPWNHPCGAHLKPKDLKNHGCLNWGGKRGYVNRRFNGFVIWSSGQIVGSISAAASIHTTHYQTLFVLSLFWQEWSKMEQKSKHMGNLGFPPPWNPKSKRAAISGDVFGNRLFGIEQLQRIREHRMRAKNNIDNSQLHLLSVLIRAQWLLD